MLETGSNSRVALYRLFTKIWNSVAVNGKADAGEVVLPPEQHLTQITPRPRQAFLLVALEGFSEEDAAEVLDCDLQTLRALVEESGRELAAEIATDVLIIEDETFIAMDIEALVESLGHNVIGIARTHSEALALAKQKRPGLILADIQLADGSSGFDAVNELLGYFRSAGHLHHRLSGTLPDRAAAGAGVPDRQAVPGRGSVRGRQPGAVLRPQGAAARTQAGRASGDAVTSTPHRAEEMAGHVPAIFLLSAAEGGAAVSAYVRKKLGRSRSAYRLRPMSAGQARGEGGRMAVRHDKRRRVMFVPIRDVALRGSV